MKSFTKMYSVKMKSLISFQTRKFYHFTVISIHIVSYPKLRLRSVYPPGDIFSAADTADVLGMQSYGYLLSHPPPRLTHWL